MKEIPPTARLILATHNTHKLTELRAILADYSAFFQPEMVISAVALDIPDPVEDGLSFRENALIKAHTVCAATGLPAVADDSGICVDVLGQSPGIFSARWAGRHGDDKANLDLLLAQLSDIAPAHRGAAFVAAAALVMPDGTEIVREGKMVGRLATAPAGSGGFGYDPIFIPTGFTQTTAELTAEQKTR